MDGKMWWIVSWHPPNTIIVLGVMLCLVVVVQGAALERHPYRCRLSVVEITLHLLASSVPREMARLGAMEIVLGWMTSVQIPIYLFGRRLQHRLGNPARTLTIGGLRTATGKSGIALGLPEGPPRGARRKVTPSGQKGLKFLLQTVAVRPVMKLVDSLQSPDSNS
jgi:hypothetical protein